MTENEINDIIARQDFLNREDYTVTDTAIRLHCYREFLDAYKRLYTRSFESLLSVLEPLPFSISIYILSGKANIKTPFAKVENIALENMVYEAAEVVAKSLILMEEK